MRRLTLRATATHGVFNENVQRLAGVIDYLGETRDFVTPGEYFDLLAARADEELERNAVLMTFDDGLLSSFEFIMSELTPRGIRVIVFVPTAIFSLTVGEQREFARATRLPGVSNLREEQYRTVGTAEVNALTRAGHTVMPHSHTHACLATLTAGELSAEVVQPRKILEQVLGQPADAFAIPYGHRNALSPLAYNVICKTYRYCFTAIGGATTVRSRLSLLRRDNLDQTATPKHAATLLNGAYDPYFAVRAWQLARNVRGERP